MFELPLAVVPRVGEQVVTPDETVMYIEAVTYTDWKIFLQLSERVVLQEVRIADTSVPVEIINGGPIEVYDRQLGTGILTYMSPTGPCTWKIRGITEVVPAKKKSAARREPLRAACLWVTY